MLPHAMLLDIPQAAHVTLITLGSVSERAHILYRRLNPAPGARLELDIVKGHSSLPSP